MKADKGARMERIFVSAFGAPANVCVFNMSEQNTYPAIADGNRNDKAHFEGRRGQGPLIERT